MILKTHFKNVSKMHFNVFNASAIPLFDRFVGGWGLTVSLTVKYPLFFFTSRLGNWAREFQKVLWSCIWFGWDGMVQANVLNARFNGIWYAAPRPTGPTHIQMVEQQGLCEQLVRITIENKTGLLIFSQCLRPKIKGKWSRNGKHRIQASGVCLRQLVCSFLCFPSDPSL